MEKTYTNNVTDIIDFYNKVFKKIADKYVIFESLDHHNQILYFTAGLALSNSIHETFITTLLEELKLSKNKTEEIKKSYKGPLSIEGFIKLLKLDLEEPFNLQKEILKPEITTISNLKNITDFIKEQRSIRNDYLHGDYDIKLRISLADFENNLIKYQKIHNFLFSLIIYSFNKNKVNIKSSIEEDFNTIKKSWKKSTSSAIDKIS